jgi:hypothetical protein
VPNTTTLTERALDRRSVLRRGLLLGGIGVLAAAPTPALAVDGTKKRRSLVLDVAMLGDTHEFNPGPEISVGITRGSTFFVEGMLFPAGTIPDGVTGWDPYAHQDLAIGRWFNSGTFMGSPSRPQPHRYSNQTHVFGLITPDNLFPPDQISSIGTESSRTQDTLPSTRAIVGGAGAYRGVSGQITQFGHGTNTTAVNIVGIVNPAPNFRFFFTFADD